MLNPEQFEINDQYLLKLSHCPLCSSEFRHEETRLVHPQKGCQLFGTAFSITERGISFYHHPYKDNIFVRYYHSKQNSSILGFKIDINTNLDFILDLTNLPQAINKISLISFYD